MTNPLILRKNSDLGSHGRKAERLAAKRLGGAQQPGSGAMGWAKGDIRKDGVLRLLFENKATTGKSFSIQRDWCYKIYQEASEQGRIPALSFQFVSGSGASERRERWVALPEHVVVALLNGEEV